MISVLIIVTKMRLVLIPQARFNVTVILVLLVTVFYATILMSVSLALTLVMQMPAVLTPSAPFLVRVILATRATAYTCAATMTSAAL